MITQVAGSEQIAVTSFARIAHMNIEEIAASFTRHGYVVLPRAMPDEALATLRDGCNHFIEQKDAEMDQLGVDQLHISVQGKRYFINDVAARLPGVSDFIFGDVMAKLCEAVLGPSAYFFHDQYVIKGPTDGLAFAWHQDSAYIGYDHPAYLTCWFALDDVDERNGTIYVLPQPVASAELVPHRRDPDTSDLIGYDGPDPGVPVVAPAGSIVLFSSQTLHSSGPNLTEKLRRAYIAQYTAEPLLRLDGRTPWFRAEPFLKDGYRHRPENFGPIHPW